MENKLLAWLDANVEARRRVFDLLKFDENIRACELDLSIHVFSGIEKLAEVAGVPLNESIRGDAEYPYQYSFVYKGIKVFQIEKGRLVCEDRI